MYWCVKHVRAVLLVLAAVAAGALACSPAAFASASLDQATAYQLDPAHDGYQTGGSITTPLSQAWSVTLSGSISYPLIVNGVVYVTASTGGGYGTSLYAIEQATGATLWSHNLGGTYFWSALTYDAGQVFALDYDGNLTAFNAQTGATDWSGSMPGQYSFSSPPTAYDGVVYVGGAGDGGTVYAVSEASGAVLWTQSVENGDDSSPAVDSSGVYVTYACGQDYDFSPLSGLLLWHHTSGCEGGGGKTPVLANGLIFGRDSSDGDLILSANSGAQQGVFGSTTAPAVGGGSAFMLSGSTLTAVGSSGEGTNEWTFTGDGHLDTAPLVGGGLVFEGSSAGLLYALDPGSGATDWSGSVGTAINGPDEQNVSQPLTGLGVGESTLVVPAGSELIAYTGANLGSGTPSNTLLPSVTGTPVALQPIGADVGLWTALPSSYSYQWSLCNSSGGGCNAIGGATAEAYTPPAADIGDTLKVTVTATNTSGTNPPVTSAASAQIMSPPPTVATAPSISGTPAVGQTLSASNGSWTYNPSSFQYQWLSCSDLTCTPIAGATSSTLAVTNALAGQDLEVQVVASNSSGSSLPAASGLVGPIPWASTPKTATAITLTSSANPTTAGSKIVFTATLSRPVDGGNISFYGNEQFIPGCAAVPVSSGHVAVTCTISSITAGTWTIEAQYDGDASYGGSTATLTEKVAHTPGTRNQLPPNKQVGKPGPKGKPNFKLTLTAVRTQASPHRYWFALKDVRCVNKATAVLVTIARKTMRDRCGASLELASKSLAVHHTYTLTLRAVHMGGRTKLVVRGPAYREKLYMPGNEVTWTPVTGISLHKRALTADAWAGRPQSANFTAPNWPL